MNIKQAKTEIKHTVQAYLKKDDMGNYAIPKIRQRPMLLMGPPGIGKTQIMEQIARECKIGLVAYTITHHTRQSAVGLPFIREAEYQGRSYSITEYTMSEIIASIYEKMKETELTEGILFIDEINCVSETLAPTMLQFLQCKTFGNQAVPQGWLIVAAGNPPEYNKSVREFDMVTLDRVRRMDIEADLSVWKEYGKDMGIHPAILSYLEIRPKNFYRVEADVDGLQFVTARGWEDLSSLLAVYESLEISVTEDIIYEFLHHRDVAEDFAAYYDLYLKYQDDYGIPEILAGKIRPEVFQRIGTAEFDERISVVNLLLNGLQVWFSQEKQMRQCNDFWYAFLKKYQVQLKAAEELQIDVIYDRLVKEEEEVFQREKTEGFLTREDQKLRSLYLKKLAEHQPSHSTDLKELFQQAKTGFDQQIKEYERLEAETAKAVEHAFDFMEQAFENGQEMVFFVTELSIGKESAHFLAEHICMRYMEYNQTLLIGTRKAELLKELHR